MSPYKIIRLSLGALLLAFSILAGVFGVVFTALIIVGFVNSEGFPTDDEARRSMA